MAPRQRFGSYRWLILLLVPLFVLYAAYVVSIGLQTRKTVARSFSPGFVGTAACAECHASIVAEHAGTHHAQALREAKAAAAELPLPPPVWVPDPDLPAAYRIAERSGQLGIETQVGATTYWQPAHWAFGSGTNGMTLVGRREDGRFVEAPLSFYRRAGWDFTVGFLAHPPSKRQKEPTGPLLSAREIADCFECHAAGVRRNENGVVLQGIEYGVQCESCHGPGEQHVRSARAGQPKGQIRMPGQASGQAMVAFCGTCHRSEPPPGVKPTDPVAVRFAPVGLQRSRCFKESKGALSCTSCHDAHGNARKEPAFYQSVCASCHGGKAQHSTCPEQPAGDCIGCHMPRQIVQRNIIFTDHWIRVVNGTASRVGPNASHPEGRP